MFLSLSHTHTHYLSLSDSLFHEGVPSIIANMGDTLPPPPVSASSMGLFHAHVQPRPVKTLHCGPYARHLGWAPGPGSWSRLLG